MLRAAGHVGHAETEKEMKGISYMRLHIFTGLSSLSLNVKFIIMYISLIVG